MRGNFAEDGKAGVADGGIARNAQVDPYTDVAEDIADFAGGPFEQISMGGGN
ncbi:hypothetical protein [Leptolyngbya sp. O-77]|uniref:hypothetical protein n=1 Tax=Leptolyngbya sp. O-77 TaxID=1080068 RepID=UPI0012E337F1|nr:hypothetical protein [Leptolyngbya sp. O-77]